MPDITYLNEALADRIHSVREQIAQAAQVCGRDPAGITLIGVSKFFPAKAAQLAFESGLQDLGENRVQEMLAKQDALLEQGMSPRWHLIGTLQKNKVKYIIGRTYLIHSVDSLELLEEISRRSEQAGVVTDVLLQVNPAREETKHGFETAEISQVTDELSNLPGVRVCGLMTIAPLFDDPMQTMPVFSATQDLFVQLKQKHPDWTWFDTLSMGMSHDFYQAIACGATHIRIGTAIFGSRPTV